MIKQSSREPSRARPQNHTTNDTHTMQVPNKIWNEARTRWNVTNPGSRLREWMIEWWAYEANYDRLNNPPGREDAHDEAPEPDVRPRRSTPTVSNAPRIDAGTLLVSTRRTLCCYCGDVIEVGDELVWFTDTEGRKRSRHPDCHSED